jgi:RimJ/RimL family protein N-acetyltransferase
MPHPWPLFDLRIRTPRLELRVPTDDHLLELLEVARAGLHDPDDHPFLVPWDELPSPAFERQFLLYWWRARGSWSPGGWTLPLAAFLDGRPVGIQDLTAEGFPQRRSVLTGSWLGREMQRRGLGTEMRAAALALAFDGLGALEATSGYLVGNRASAGVSEKLGYVANGARICRLTAEGEPVTEQALRVTPETWRRDVVPVTIENLEPCLGLFGARPQTSEESASV